jgi:DNA-binding NtrC family response regulator
VSLPTILILEDSKVQAELITKMVMRAGWAAVVAKSQETALEALHETRADLLLLDVYVGETNTLGNLSTFRTAAPKAAIAIMSAGAQSCSADATLAAARQARVDYVLQKPFPFEALAKILNEIKSGDRQPQRLPHIAVIEDSRVIRTLCERIITLAGYRVSTADSMDDALGRLDMTGVDLVLTDLFMPGMDGVEGIALIHATWPGVRVVAMSAGAESQSHGDALRAAEQAGACARLPKPFTASDLTRLIQTVMETPA